MPARTAFRGAVVPGCSVRADASRLTAARWVRRIRGWGMKHRKFACLLGAVLLACASAVAQPPQLPDPNQLPNVPKPQIQFKPRDPGAPLPMQTTLPVQSFAVSDLKCAANLASATQRLVAKLTIQPGPIMRTTAEIDTVIDGVSVGKQTLPIQSGAVVVDRTITVRGGASAQHQAVFVLDNAVRSASQAFSHACVSATQPRRRRSLRSLRA